MLRIAAASLRSRWPSLAGAFVALTLGAALLIGCAEVLAAAARASHHGPVRYAAAPVVVVGSPSVAVTVGAGEDREVDYDRNRQHVPIDPALAARVAALPGVTRTVADRSFAVRAPAGEGGSAVGHPWAARLATPYRLVRGRAPAAWDEVAAVVGAGGDTSSLGAVRTLVTPAGPAPYRVVGLVAPSRGGGIAYEQPLFFDDVRAAALAPAIDALAVWPRTAAEEVGALLAAEHSSAVALTDDRRAEAERNPADDAGAAGGVLLSMMAMTVAFVTMLAVASAFSFAVALRRRELGLLRAIGATPRQIRRLVLREAALVGAVAAAAGGAASLVVGPAIGAWLSRRGLTPAALHVMPSLKGAVVGSCCMLVVALAGAWATARRAARVRPTEALRDAAVDRGTMTLGRWAVGLPSLAAAGLVLSKGASADPLGQLMLGLGESICLILGLTMLAPLIVPWLVALVVLPARGLRQPAALLARRHARAAVRRTSAIAGPVLVIVGLAGALSTLFGTLAASDRALAQARVAPDAAVVSADDAGGLSEADLTALRAIPGGRVAATLETDVRVMASDGITPAGTVGVDPEAIPLALRLRVLDGSLARLNGNTVALGGLAARTLHLRVGDRFGGWLPDGTRVDGLEVVALLADGLGATSVYVPRSLLAGHVGAVTATSAYLQPTGDAAPVLDALRRVADARGLSLHGGAALRAVTDPTDSSNMNPLALGMIVGIAALYVAIGLASTAAVATAARSGELALLRLAGATPRQLLGLVAFEALATTAVGALLGLAVTGIVAGGLGRSLEAVAGPTALAIDWGLLTALLAGCAAIAVAASVLAAARTQRRAPHQVVGLGGS